MNFDGAIFLDCGSHNGQTLAEVTKPEYGFKRIYGFEPMPQQFAELDAKYGDDERVELCNFGLSDRSGTFPIYGSNDICEASLYANKRDVNRNVVTECQIVDASKWFASNISADDRNYMKFNCEGAEVPILSSLLDSGEIWKLSHTVITWDCRCIAGEEHHETELVGRMRSIGFDRWVSSDDAFYPHTQPHEEKIAQWLRSVA